MGEFDHETQAFGLATPGGTDADTASPASPWGWHRLAVG